MSTSGGTAPLPEPVPAGDGADLAEQERDLVVEDDGSPVVGRPDGTLPAEADPGDVAEQSVEIGFGDDDEPS